MLACWQAIDDHLSDTFLSQVVRHGKTTPKARIEALTLAVCMQTLLGKSWTRLGRRNYVGAHLLEKVMDAWRDVELHFENTLRLRARLLRS
jgi:hypothetical protein